MKPAGVFGDEPHHTVNTVSSKRLLNANHDPSKPPSSSKGRRLSCRSNTLQYEDQFHKQLLSKRKKTHGGEQWDRVYCYKHVEAETVGGYYRNQGIEVHFDFYY